MAHGRRAPAPESTAGLRPRTRPAVPQQQLALVVVEPGLVRRRGVGQHLRHGHTRVMLRQGVVRRRGEQGPRQPPDTALELEPRRVAARLRAIARQQLLVQQQRDVLPLAPLALRHRGERRSVRAVRLHVRPGVVIREPNERPALPGLRRCLARERRGNRILRSPSFGEIPHALRRDPEIRGGRSGGRIEKADQPRPRVTYPIELARRRWLLLVVPVAEPPYLLIARIAAARALRLGKVGPTKLLELQLSGVRGARERRSINGRFPQPRRVTIEFLRPAPDGRHLCGYGKRNGRGQGGDGDGGQEQTTTDHCETERPGTRNEGGHVPSGPRGGNGASMPTKGDQECRQRRLTPEHPGPTANRALPATMRRAAPVRAPPLSEDPKTPTRPL